MLRGIHTLLYDDGYTIKGVQKVLRDRGVRALVDAVKAGETVPGSLAARLHEATAEESSTAAATPAAGAQGEIRAAIDALGEIKKLLESGRPDS